MNEFVTVSESRTVTAHGIFNNILDEFDRVVFESIVDKVIVGETNEDGTVDPYKLTFVMKGNGNSVVPNAKEWFKAEKSGIQPA